MNLEIREAKHEEAALIVTFQIAMAQESEGMALDPASVTKGVEAVFRDPAKGQYFVALSNEKLIACTLIQYEWSDWRNRTVLWIHSLYVLPAHRGRGIFRAIYDFLKRRVESSAALGGLRLYVDQRNANAIHAYEKLGMTREHYHLYEWLKT